MRQFSLKLRKILLFDPLYYVLLLLIIIYIFAYTNKYIPPNKYDISDNNFILTIENYNIDGDKLSISFKENMIGKYYFNSLNEKNIFLNNYHIGDTLKIKGELIFASNNTIKNTYNYKKYLFHKGIIYTLNIEDYNIYKNNKNIFNKIKNLIYMRVRKINNNSYLYAFILGNSSYIDNEVYTNYKINGVTHLFALSGLHVSLFSNLILFILKKLKLNEFSSFIITSIFLIFFAFIASFTPSILRAVIFFILSNINKIYYLYIKPKYLLYLTFVILILINPNYIFNTGFILSFSITFFILLFNEKHKVSGQIKSILTISFLSFLSSLPIVINMSYEINIIGFFNNIIFIPLVTYIIFPLSLVVILIPKLSPVLYILTSIMEKISYISTNILNLTINFQKLTNIEIITYYVLFILIIKNKYKFIYLYLILIIYIYFKPSFDKNSYVYYIDVSQGDSALIITKNNKSILIDTGGKSTYSYYEEWNKRNKEFNLMKQNIIPFFKSIGLKKIDYLFISHGDADHLGYANDLIDNFKVKNIYINVGNINYNEKRLNAKIIDKEYLEIDNVKIYSLNNVDYKEENANSMVLLIYIDNTKFLFMGDANRKTELNILEKFNLKNIEFLKVGHHGSDTSSGEYFINSISPKYSIISVGANNRFGHPKDEVLDTLKNSKIYRTDLNGSIEIKLNKNGYKIRTCPP